MTSRVVLWCALEVRPDLRVRVPSGFGQRMHCEPAGDSEMNTNARAASADPVAAGIADRGRADSAAGDVVGRLFRRISLLPALVLAAWLLAGLPLLLAGQFRPALMFAVSVPLAVVLVVFGLRWIPDQWGSALSARQPEHVRTPWWALAGVVVVAVAFGVDQTIYHSQFIIVLRDPASYYQFGYWIAHHGALPIPQDRAAFGGTHGVLSFGSPAFYQDGTGIVPQFMAGLPMVLAPAFWIGGAGAALLIAPALGACAVLTFGGLAARLVGPRWAPLAALVLALCLPEQFTSRSTYSEPLTEILLLGGLCLVVDSIETDGIGSRVAAALGGLLLGLTVLGRIDGASDILPVIPYCGLLLVGRRRQALPLLGGLLVGAAYGCVDGLVLSRPYLASIGSSLVPLLLAVGAVTLATAVAVALLWRRGLPTVRRKWLPNAVALLTVVVMIGFAVRPYLQTVRAGPNTTTASTVAAAQQASHLPIDPDRLYYEISLHWVFWYIGIPAVVLGTLAAALLFRRCLAGRAPTWTLPLITFAWATVTFLYRPAITPDQPWASRRLVAAVLPGMLLLAVWGSSWLVGWLRQRGLGPLARGGFAFVLRGSSGAARRGAHIRPGYRPRRTDGDQAHCGRLGVQDHVPGRDRGSRGDVREDSRPLIGRDHRSRHRPQAHRSHPRDVRQASGNSLAPRPGRTDGGRARHHAVRAAASFPGGQAVRAGPLRRPGEEDHDAANQEG